MKLKGFVMMTALLCCFAVFATAQNLQNRLPSRAHASAANAPATTPQKSTGARSEADTCAYTFTVAGSNNNYMEFCVSVNGNVISFQSPAGIEYLDLGALAEGYGICDFTSGTSYYDYSDYGISGNWNAPVTLSSSATAVKIQRTTSDGIYTLTMTFTKVTGTTPYAKITMALKNNTAVARDVYLIRWADIDPFNATSSGSFQESFDSTINAAWGYEALDYTGANYAGHGLMLENLGVPNVTSGWGGYNLAINSPPTDVCAPLDVFGNDEYLGYEASVDGSVEMLYFLELGKQKTGTVNSRYLAF
jgi:hypothetical protein